MKTKVWPIIVWLLFSASLCFGVKQVSVSVIFSSDEKPYQESWEGFKKFFDENKIALRPSEHHLSKEPSELVSSKINKEKPDLVLVIGMRALNSVKGKIKDIPVVFSMSLGNEEDRGENITGVAMNIPAKLKLEKAKEIFSGIKRIGLIYSTKESLKYKKISETCKELGLELVSKEVGSAKEFPGALKGIDWQIDCFLMIPDSSIYFVESVKHLLSDSLEKKYMVIGLSSPYTKAGALFSLDCDLNDIGRQSGEIALKIIEGEKPGSIPLIFPRKTRLSLNRIAAKRVGIKLSDDILKEASEVFEE
ncbi:MAG: ABC transporter substrate-binding protein [Elusimicrobia bacterium]|nr:ABC transporter substrate-binding protein [Candidatus Liberimonas magnetica]